MKLSTRNMLDKAFTAYGFFAMMVMVFALLLIMIPIFVKGSGAFIFRSTVEHRRFILEKMGRGNPESVQKEFNDYNRLRQPLYDMIANFKVHIHDMDIEKKNLYESHIREIEKELKKLFGPRNEARQPIMVREQYGQTRWDMARVILNKILFEEQWDYSNPDKMGVKVMVERKSHFSGTSMEHFFDYLEQNINNIMVPKLTFYWRFLTDRSFDSHIFGGVWAELLGTFYLTIGAMIFVIPIGIIAAVYLTEYSKQGIIVSLIRTCVSTLAGVPSIVFGLFGLAFFIYTIGVTNSKSVLAGSLTLAILVLPTVIRASEEAIRSVPQSHKEAALSLGAGKWYTVITVILPAALPGILTGIVISMGRAAGETAPIIFTAAVSVGQALGITRVFSEPTPALSWNIYNLSTEHEAVDMIRHVQFGMVLTLVGLVLFLNATAIYIRARVSKKLKG